MACLWYIWLGIRIFIGNNKNADEQKWSTVDGDDRDMHNYYKKLAVQPRAILLFVEWPVCCA